MTPDATAGRLTPYEMVFGVENMAEREFPAIVEEAERRGIEPARRREFAYLDAAAALLGRLVPEQTDPGALDRYFDILFHCFHFWRAGCPLYAFEEPAIRDLIETGPELSGWSPRETWSALYFELPRNLFWAAVSEGEPPEPVEGLFMRLGPAAEAADFLLILGMRADRPGFSVAAFVARLDPAGAPGEPDSFLSDIPGAELAALYSLGRSSEALLLALRLLWYLDAYPEAAEAVRGVAGRGQAGSDRPSALDHYRVRLVERSHG